MDNEIVNSDNNKSNIYSNVSSIYDWDNETFINDNSYCNINYDDPVARAKYELPTQLGNRRLRSHLKYLSNEQQHNTLSTDDQQLNAPSIDDQQQIRYISTDELAFNQNNSNNKFISPSNNYPKHTSPINTILIASDSILNQLNERKLSRHYNVNF